LFIHCILHPISFQFFSGIWPFIAKIDPNQSFKYLPHTHNIMQTPTTQTTQTTQPVEEEYDFENDDDAFYDFIEFGIASNGGRLSIQRR